MKSFAFFIRVLNPEKEGYTDGQNVQFHLERLCSELGVELRTAETFSSIGQITDIIKDALERADLIFAEVSAPNENVWYEVGYSDRINEGKVIILCRDGVKLPFDRAHQKTYFFAPNDHKKTEILFRSVRHAAESVLSVSVIMRLILADRPEDTIPEYIQNNPKIRDASIQTLKDLAGNVERPAEVRRRAVHVLSRMGETDSASLIRLTRRLTDASVREEVFSLIENMMEPVPEEVWQNAHESRLSVPVMRAAARAAGKHFSRGIIARDIAVSYFVHHDRWEPRKHFLTAILKNSQNMDLDDLMHVASIMINDDSEEVTNRFLDWLRKVKVQPSFSENEIAVLSVIQRKHKKAEARKMALSLLKNKKTE